MIDAGRTLKNKLPLVSSEKLRFCNHKTRTECYEKRASGRQLKNKTNLMEIKTVVDNGQT